MPRFSLQTLIVVMLLGGPLCAWGWRDFARWRAKQAVEAQRQHYITELEALYVRVGQLPPNPDNRETLQAHFADYSNDALRDVLRDTRDIVQRAIGPPPPAGP
jgi:hypothetical protein